MLDDLTNYLATNNVGILGQTLFEYYRPDKLDNCYMLKDTGGPVGDDAKYMPVKTVTFQVITRGSTEPIGHAAAEVINNFLHNTAGTTMKQLGSTFFFYVLKLQEPQSLGKDSSGRYDWSQNFVCLIR